MCLDCRAQRRANLHAERAERKKLGICEKCGKRNRASVDRNHGPGWCTGCWGKQLAYNHLGSTKRWPEMYAILEKQKHRCIYTGELLVVGVNASVDHIVPKCRGGNPGIENIQWVEKNVNWAKSRLSHDEFLNMIHKIVDYFALDKRL